MKPRTHIIIFLFVASSLVIMAQKPDWNVNLANYEHRMSVTAVLEIDGVASADTNDLVAAFVNGETRGVGSPKVFVAALNKYLLLFQIGSNVAAGEVVNFKYYQNATGQITDVRRTEVYAADASLGSTNNPYIITKNFFVNAAPVAQNERFSIPENAPKDTEIGIVKATDKDSGQTVSFVLLVNDTANAPFSINSQSGLLTVKNTDSLDFERKALFVVNVLVKDSDAKSLTDTARIEIAISDVPESMPLPANNLITPNGDGINDYFQIDNPEVYTGFKLLVFNPSGEVVYSTDNYLNTWDGRKNGSPLPSGLYYYLFENNSTGIFYKGTISLKSK